MPKEAADRRLSFENVLEIVRRGALRELRREPKEQEKYNRLVEDVLARYETIEDYILWKVFDLTTSRPRGESGKLACVLPPDLGRITKWRENEFPYWVEENVRHHILWSTEPIADEEIVEMCDDFLKTKEYVYFVNPPNLRSVSRIWHAHVLFLHSDS